ncbi:MAG: hypothetical protein C4583_04375 [Anaerolineaceae bacterium]|nr:MAG: hypothetical protein C4583_04375 [Anaerolineaceae bacterium]
MEEQKKFLSVEEILSADDIPSCDEYVPEWGGWVHLVGLDGREASQFSKRMVRIVNGKPVAQGLDNFMAKLLADTIRDPQTNQRMFTVEQVEALGRKSAMVLKRLAAKASELSGMSEEANEAAEKNSETPDGDSPTD